MVDVDELQQKELENIEDNDKKAYDLESLILDGANARIPIIIDYPTEGGGTIELALKIKPLTDVDINNAIRAFRKNKNTSIRIEYLKRGLYTKDDKPFPSHLLKEMYTGAITSLYDKLCDVSGIHVSKEDAKEFREELMGF